MVWQDFARYQVTLREAVALGDLREGAKVDTERALREIGLDAAKLPQGADTPLGKISEGGVDLAAHGAGALPGIACAHAHPG